MGSRGQNLLNSRFDHDSCGVGFVATLHGAPSHDILRLTLTALARLAHRGAVAADRKSSDGVGVLTAVPRNFLFSQTAIALPPERPLAVGMLFLPLEGVTSRDALRFEECISDQGLQWLAWREVPIRREVLGELALESLPVIRQALISAPDSVHWTEAEVEHRLYLARKAFERCSEGSYVCSLSTRTLVYKAMCAGRLLHEISPPRLRSFTSDTQPTCCPPGIARSRCECWRTTARSTPSGAIAPTWKRGARLCYPNASPCSPSMLPIR